jgi:hypothetical protein
MLTRSGVTVGADDTDADGVPDVYQTSDPQR